MDDNPAAKMDTIAFDSWMSTASATELLRMADALSDEIYEANHRLSALLRVVATRRGISL